MPKTTNQQCCAQVSQPHSWRTSQCSRNGKVQAPDGKWYCTQHSPAKRAERDAAWEAKYKAEREKNRPKLYAKYMLDIIRQVAAGYNDPRGMCIEFLIKYDNEGK